MLQARRMERRGQGFTCFLFFSIEYFDFETAKKTKRVKEMKKANGSHKFWAMASRPVGPGLQEGAPRPRVSDSFDFVLWFFCPSRTHKKSIHSLFFVVFRENKTKIKTKTSYGSRGKSQGFQACRREGQRLQACRREGQGFPACKGEPPWPGVFNVFVLARSSKITQFKTILIFHFFRSGQKKSKSFKNNKFNKPLAPAEGPRVPGLQEEANQSRLAGRTSSQWDRPVL